MLKVKDWNKFQHYKDRNPPWIKLETDTFQNYDFSCLQSASKLLAICIWTLASRSKEGYVPSNFDYIKKWGQLGNDVTEKHLKELIDKGYLLDCSTTLADCKQPAIPETYSKETETKTESMVSFEVFWARYPRKEKRKESVRAYQKALKSSSHDEIMAGVDRYLLNKPSYADWAHPSSWLNGERWRDNYEDKKSQIISKPKTGLLVGSEEWKRETGRA